jgi:hypothetical protein
MKKIYISPEIASLQLAAELPVADSQIKSGGDVTDITYGGKVSSGDNIAPEVKTNSYNVWNDDWSK